MYNVIVADDETAIRKGIVMLIDWERYGFRVIGDAENGAEALKITDRYPVDLIVTDIRMPVLDGLKLAETLKNRNPRRHIRIVLMSAYRDFEYAQKAIRFGVRDYILKPISEDKLIDILRNLRSELEEEETDYRRIDGGVVSGPNRTGDCGRGTDVPVSASSPPRDMMIDQMKHYICKHCCGNITLREIAKMYSYNTEYLGRMFRNATGMKFQDYLNYCRVERAETLLAGGDKIICEVSSAVGYRDINYFYRMFKRYRGYTPGESKNRRAQGCEAGRIGVL